MDMKSYVLGMFALAAGMMAGSKKGYLDPFGRTFDNSQRIIEVICPKCNQPFETKAQGGYTNCKKCNDKTAKK
jgi:hypothetical protein